MGTRYRPRAGACHGLLLLALIRPDVHAAEPAGAETGAAPPPPAAATPDTPPAPPIAPFTQRFRFTTSGLPFGIGAERTLAAAGDGTWIMQLKARNWLGEIRETTRFRWNGCLPETLSWEYQRTGLGANRRAAIVIDPDKGTVEVTERDRPPRSYPLPGPSTDKVSQVLALQCMLERGERPLRFPVADEDGVEQVRYVIRARERIETPAGRLPVLRLELIREPDSGRTTTLWFAPGMNHALVRMVQQEDDHRHQLTIQD